MSSQSLSSKREAPELRQNERATLPWGQIAAITAGAIAIFVGFRLLPTGTNLSHSDFQVSGGNSIEFCDPSNPQFIPVVAVRSPVEMSIAQTDRPPKQGEVVRAAVKLATSSGKTIAPADLLVTHTEKLHLLILDPQLRDYQHVHPTPGAEPGIWEFSFTPAASGVYRVFADFTPSATARGLYASADLPVAPDEDGGQREPAPKAEVASQYERGEYRFTLKAVQSEVKAREVADFRFSVARRDGSPAVLEPVMDALAHLVAVDSERSGFAHLHPTGTAGLAPSNTPHSTPLEFKITIPNPGRYVVWAQVKIDGQEHYAPFWVEVRA